MIRAKMVKKKKKIRKREEAMARELARY